MVCLLTQFKVQIVVFVLTYLMVANYTVISNGQLQQPSIKNRSSGNSKTSGLRNSSVFKRLTRLSTNRQQIKLFCRVGRFLSMDKNGTISGVLRQNGRREVFELQSYGPSIVRIKHKATRRYLVMNSKGRLRGRKNPDLKDTYFFQNHEENTFVSFASYYHRKKNGLQMFVGIKRGGDVKYGRHTHAGQDSIQFLLLFVNYYHKRQSKRE